jgi:GH24 family phage-related lysozyme (muramidase)
MPVEVLSSVESRLLERDTWIADRPQGARDACMDMAVNLGVQTFLTQYNSFLNLVYAGNWYHAADDSWRKGVSDERNQWTRTSILSCLKYP